MTKALFPIGKTQWAKWNDTQRNAFNEAREAGVPYNDAVQAANQTQAAKKKGFFDVVEGAVGSVAGAAATVTSVTAAVSPALAVAKTVANAAGARKNK
jgi:hypothetical protein